MKLIADKKDPQRSVPHRNRLSEAAAKIKPE